MTQNNNENRIMINAKEISNAMGISVTYAYKIVNQLNAELSEKGFLVVRGRTNRRYFYQRVYAEVC